MIVGITLANSQTAKLISVQHTHPPIFTQNTGGSVDLQHYSGTWYVIACIPTRFDSNWEHIVESYTIKDSKKIEIDTTYTVGEDATQKHVHSKGFVRSKDNSFWRVQFFWPLRTDYLIEEVGANYSYAVIGHRNKKYLYILSRTPYIDLTLYANILDRYSFKGYNMSLMRKVAQ
jgi:apolipoprotein D and lipocalin family protein